MNARLVALLVSAISAALIVQRAEAYPAEVTGVHYLKVRSAPDLEAAEAGIVAAGDVVDVIGEVGRWASVTLSDGAAGYVSRKYLAPITATAHAEEPHNKDVRKEPRHGEDVEDIRKRDTAELQEPREPTQMADEAPPPQGSPPPLTMKEAEDPAAAAGTAMPSAQQPALCTSSDLDGIRRELRQLAEGQDRLAELIGSRAGELATRDWSFSLSTRQMLFWLVAGCVLGWLTAAGLRRRSDRRQRSRIRM